MLELVDAAHVTEGGEYRDKYPTDDEHGAQYDRERRRLQGRSALGSLQFAKEKAEARHHESKSHKRNAGSDPRQERPVLGKIITPVAIVAVL